MRGLLRDDLLCSYHVVRMASVRNTRKVRGVSKARENNHWQKKQVVPPLIHSSEGDPGAIACFGRSLTGRRALLTVLASPRAFQPQAVGFILADDLFGPVSPTATSDKIGPKTRPRYAGQHLPLSSSMGTWLPNNSASPPKGSQPVVGLASTAVRGRVHRRSPAGRVRAQY